MATLVGIARQRGVAGYVGDGTNRWPAVHRSDAARLARLAVEAAPAGSVLHAVADEGVPFREIAEAMGRHLGIPTASVAPADAVEHFAHLGHFVALDSPATAAVTRELLGWEPTGPSLLEDLEQDHYYRQASDGGVGVSTGATSQQLVVGMTPEEMADLVHLRRARDLIDRDYAQPLDVPAMARAALMSPAHFSRKFRAAYGETPYSYLMTRRIERAKALLRQGMSVTDTCVAVGCTSLGSFSSRFTEIVGETPSQYRARDHRDLEVVPSCVSMVATRPRRTAVTV